MSKLLLDADGNLETREKLGQATWPSLLDRPNLPPAFRGPPSAPAVHRGAIGSADRLLRNAVLRDHLASEYGILAVEMEGSGIAVASDLNGLYWYVVRGIADLADGAKNDLFHPYAALVAAAYVRALLGELNPPPGTANLPGDGFAVIISALTLLLDDEQDRRTVLRRLPERIRTQVPSRDTARVQAVALADTCERFDGGGQSLLDAVGAVAGGHPRFPDFAKAMRLHWRGL